MRTLNPDDKCREVSTGGFTEVEGNGTISISAWVESECTAPSKETGLGGFSLRLREGKISWL
jgi:hypothetical protein